MDKINRQFVLANRPVGDPTEDNFRLVESAIPALRQGQVLIKVEYISVDPYIRGRMSARRSYVRPYKIDEVIASYSVGRVMESRSEKLKAGDYVEGLIGWQEYAAVSDSCVRKLDEKDAPVSYSLGVLGMTGLTAYFGLLDIGKPQKGETVVVSGAAGAVGTVVGQIAKIKGCRVVGIAGGEAKCRYLVEELGFDAAIDYKNVKNIRLEIKSKCPDGVDVYFDNVGGEVSDAVLSMINDDARIAICGLIDQYNMLEIPRGPRIQGYLLTHTALMKGFLVFKYMDRYDEGLKDLTQWVKEGRLKPSETIVEGFENTPKTFLGLFTGQNIGKLIVHV